MLTWLIPLPRLSMFLFVACLLITLLLLLLFMVSILLLLTDLFGTALSPRLQLLPRLFWVILIPLCHKRTSTIMPLSHLMKSLISEHVVQTWASLIWITLVATIFGPMGLFGPKYIACWLIPYGVTFSSHPMCIFTLRGLSLITQELTFRLVPAYPLVVVPSSFLICGLTILNIQAKSLKDGNPRWLVLLCLFCAGNSSLWRVLWRL